jgi:hypothetical protein
MHRKYSIGFEDDQVGCRSLGYCEREGRDRAEDERRYAEFLRREGYVVISVEDGVATVAADARGVVRSHTVSSLTTRLAAILDDELIALADDLQALLGRDAALDDRAPLAAHDLAAGVDALNRARTSLVRART